MVPCIFVILLDTYLLVQFLEGDSISIVPIKRVKMQEKMAVGDKPASIMLA